MRLTEEIKQTIQQDADLYAKVCIALGKAPSTLPAILKRNDSRLLQINVLQIIRKHTSLKDSEILTETSKVTA